MVKKLAGVSIAALVVAAALLGASSRSAPPVQAKPINALVINQETCFLIGTAFAGGAAIECGSPQVGNFALNLHNLANRLAKRPVGDPTNPTLEDFAGIDLDRNMLHEEDGVLFVAVFLADQSPIDITVSNASIVPINMPPQGSRFRCDTAASGTGGDPDCVIGQANGDGAYAFAVVPDDTTERGPGTITIVQNRFPIDIGFTVVGEPNSISITTLKTTLQVGASDLEGELPFLGDDCRLATSASGFLDANGTPERTVALAIVRDIDGTAITGAGVVWSSDDPDIASTATIFTPTIDLGSFGTGAPEILCGTQEPGATKIRARTVAVGPVGDVVPNGLPIDLLARDVRATKEITVTGFPDSIALAAVPPTINCDGVTTSTVSATILTADGTPVQDGNPVTFDVQALAIANPIIGKTAGGVATSVISPLRVGEQKGVTVNVSVPTGENTNPVSGVREDDVLPVTAGIFVACSGEVGAPVAGDAGGSGAAAGSGNAPQGIRGPDTGSGGNSLGKSLSIWPALALIAAAVALAGFRARLARD